MEIVLRRGGGRGNDDDDDDDRASLQSPPKESGIWSEFETFLVDRKASSDYPPSRSSTDDDDDEREVFCSALDPFLQAISKISIPSPFHSQSSSSADEWILEFDSCFAFCSCSDLQTTPLLANFILDAATSRPPCPSPSLTSRLNDFALFGTAQIDLPLPLNRMRARSPLSCSTGAGLDDEEGRGWKA